MGGHSNTIYIIIPSPLLLCLPDSVFLAISGERVPERSIMNMSKGDVPSSNCNKLRLLLSFSFPILPRFLPVVSGDAAHALRLEVGLVSPVCLGWM